MASPLALVAPLLIPLDNSGTHYEGYICLNDRSDNSPASRWWLRITDVPPAASQQPLGTTATLEIGDELAHFISGYETVIQDRMKDSKTLETFIVELRSILAHIASQRPSIRIARPAAFYSTLKAELEAITWGRVLHLAEDLSSLKLYCTDAAHRGHSLIVTLPSDYPTRPPSISADLPVQLTLKWSPGHGLSHVLQQFEESVASYQLLWDDLDDMDANAWVIEPINASRSAVHRRIAVGNHVTLHVTLNPLAPRDYPEFQLMGPDRAVQPLREKLLAHRRHWKERMSLRENLECAVGALPRKSADAEEAEDLSAECAICYAYRLPKELTTNDNNTSAGAAAAAAADDGNKRGGLMMETDHDGPDDMAGLKDEDSLGAVPDVNCDNPTCGKPFHRRCIGEWLAADPGTRQSFGTLFGTCPYCSAALTVKMLAAT